MPRAERSTPRGIRPINLGMPLFLCVLVALLVCAPVAAAAERPNVVVLMTDDQTMADLEVMPRVQELVGAAGVSFDRSYVSYPVC